MPGLILKLRPFEEILVNGVVLQNGDRGARLSIKSPGARILRLRDAIHPEDADTAVRRACLEAQRAVAGPGDKTALASLVRTLAALGPIAATLGGEHHVDAALASLGTDDAYGALRALRQLMILEDVRPAKTRQTTKIDDYEGCAAQASPSSGIGGVSSSEGIA